MLSTVLILYSAKTISRNPVWKDNYTLFTSDLKNSPNSVKLKAAAAGALIEKADKETDVSFKKALLGEAIQHLQKALAAHPSYADAWLLLGVAYWNRDRDYERTVASYLKSIEFRSQSYDTYRNLGSVYNEAGEFDKAIECFQKAIKLDPQRPEGYYYLGITNENKKRLDLAIESYKKAIEIDARYISAYNKLGFVYANYKNDYENASEYLRKAIALGIADFTTYDSLGIVYNLKKDYRSALAALKTAMELNPGNPGSYLNLAMTYQSMGDRQKAEEYFFAIYGITAYLVKSLMPVKLSAFYPYPVRGVAGLSPVFYLSP
jgi:tetratricopeptide (TPR) repeat protein